MSVQYRNINSNRNKKKLDPTVKSKIDTLIELFPDWTADDLIDLVLEYDDLETIIDKITSGAVAKWDEVKKPIKRDKKEHQTQFSHQPQVSLPKPEDDWTPAAAAAAAAASSSSKGHTYTRKRQSQQQQQTQTQTQSQLQSQSQQQQQASLASAPSNSSGTSGSTSGPTIATSRNQRTNVIPLEKLKSNIPASKRVSRTTSWASAIASENSSHIQNADTHSHRDSSSISSSYGHQDAHKTVSGERERGRDRDRGEQSGSTGVTTTTTTTAAQRRRRPGLPTLPTHGTVATSRATTSAGTTTGPAGSEGKKLSWAAVATLNAKSRLPVKKTALENNDAMKKEIHAIETGISEKDKEAAEEKHEAPAEETAVVTTSTTTTVTGGEEETKNGSVETETHESQVENEETKNEEVETEEAKSEENQEGEVKEDESVSVGQNKEAGEAAVAAEEANAKVQEEEEKKDERRGGGGPRSQGD